jgi:hypothetical protein
MSGKDIDHAVASGAEAIQFPEDDIQLNKDTVGPN